MSRIPLIASLALALALAACGNDDDRDDRDRRSGRSTIWDNFRRGEMNDDGEETNDKQPSEQTDGGNQAPTIDARNFVREWQAYGEITQTSSASPEPYKKEFHGTWTFDYADRQTVLVPENGCLLPARVEGAMAWFEKGFRCDTTSTEGHRLITTVEDGGMELLHEGHLYLGLKYSFRTVDLSPPVTGEVVLIAELKAPGHGN